MSALHWHDLEHEAYQPDDDPRPGSRLAAIVVAVVFVAAIAALVFAIGAITSAHSGRVRHEVSKAQPQSSFFGIDRMSDLFWWLR